ncbi:MAG TPA: hypothetical protein VHD63_05725 [Ktedonobacteraceae bacterium]|nr:hypothetical protein [Ktedonobacteraceae bacterium]
MFKRFRPIYVGFPLLLCALLVLMSACSLFPGGANGAVTPTVIANASTPNSGATGTAVTQTVPMPQTQTSCPADNTARAAVMRPLARGKLQNLIYIYNEVPEITTSAIGHLRRYDVSNGHKAEVVSSGIRIDQAQISADGQWILFLSIPDPHNDAQHAALLQLVRMDGEGLQTLYCFPQTTYSTLPNLSHLPIALQWSVDEKSILISVNTKATASEIFVLDVATGTLRQLFLEQTNASYYYSVMTWLDNTHFYVIKQGSSSPTPPATVYLMDASTATPANPGLKQILTTTTRQSYYSLDSSFDGTLLYSSYCLLAASPFSTNIQVGPASGGSRHAIYQDKPHNCVQTLRTISTNTLLMLVQTANSTGTDFKDEVWTMNLLANSTKALTTLTNPNSGQTDYNFNLSSQYTWSNVSRDGSYYALQARDPIATNQTILVCPTKGGDPVAIAVTNPGTSSVSLAGWTTL